jgi:hypothetical protein
VSKYAKNSGALLGWLNITTKFMFSIIALFMLAVLAMNAQTTTKKSDFIPKAEFMIVLDWEDGSENDLDLWLLDPRDRIVNYTNMNTGVSFLDRDNLGHSTNNYVDEKGATHKVASRREIITIRQVVAGKWSVSVHYFGGVGPNVAKVSIIKLNPYQEIITRVIKPDYVKEEDNIASFEMHEDGTVSDVIPEGMPFINEVLSGSRKRGNIN